MEIDDDSYPMVVTPAPSSPESIAQNTDLKHLWQGRLSSRCIPSEELDQNYKVSYDTIVGVRHSFVCSFEATPVALLFVLLIIMDDIYNRTRRGGRM